MTDLLVLIPTGKEVLHAQSCPEFLAVLKMRQIAYLEGWMAKHRNFAKRGALTFLSLDKSHGLKSRWKWCFYNAIYSFCRQATKWFKSAIIDRVYFESQDASKVTLMMQFVSRTKFKFI